jgi:hypothetical protein
MTQQSLIDRLHAFQMPPELIAFRDNAALEIHLASLEGVDVAQIGQSRLGQPLYGMRFGNGPLRVSIIAGSHSDEPAGPMTAQALPVILREFFPQLLARCTFCVVPQMNPDGADRNRPWFSEPPALEPYTRHAFREGPGEDIEFGFGEGPSVRPECHAAMEFLRANGPFHLHASLHGMGYAHGAWFLLCREWAARAVPMMDTLSTLCAREGLPLHDIDRAGEKGFERIRPGFCTTPHSRGMRAHFLALGDTETADKFLPSSMEFVQGLGGGPLCLVSEMPVFRIAGAPSLDPADHQHFRTALATAKAEHALGSLAAAYGLSPVPFALQSKMQLAMLLCGLDQVAGN